MEIKNYSRERISFTNGKENYTFINIAPYKNQEEDEWILISYNNKVKDDATLTIGSTINDNGTYHSIALGYGINSIIRRTLECNQEGNLERDYITIFNPQNTFQRIEYNATFPPNIPFEDYFDEDYRTYQHNKAGFINNILPDSIVENYLENNLFFGKFLNTYAKNEKELKEKLAIIHSTDEMADFVWNDQKVYQKIKAKEEK